MQRVKSIVSWRLNGVISKPKLFLCLHVLGRFDKLPHRLVPFFASNSRCQPCDPNTFPWLAIFAWLRVIIRKNILQLAEAIRSKSTSRGCGPVLWKWALRQKFSRLIHLMIAHQFNIFRSQFYMAISSNDFQHCKDKLCQHHLWFVAEDRNVVAPTCKSILYSGMADTLWTKDTSNSGGLAAPLKCLTFLGYLFLLFHSGIEHHKIRSGKIPMARRKRLWTKPCSFLTKFLGVSFQPEKWSWLQAMEQLVIIIPPCNKWLFSPKYIIKNIISLRHYLYSGKILRTLRGSRPTQCSRSLFWKCFGGTLFLTMLEILCWSVLFWGRRSNYVKLHL